MMNETTLEKNLAETGIHVSTTVGWSMYPMLRNRRDRIVLTAIGDKVLKKYDLPLYRLPNGKFVLHRILKVCDGYYVIRGDNTYRLERVPFSWVQGYVTEFYRGKKHYSVDSRAYRFYISFWRFLYPIRYVVVGAKRLAGRVYRKLFKKKK